MLHRTAARPVAAVTRAAQTSRSFSSTPAQQATLRELESRVKSVKNIEKITKSMKMIATTRLAKAQQAMSQAKAYGAANTVVFKEAEADKVDESGQKTLFIAITSDRGLCGGIHSSVSKATRKQMEEAKAGEDASSSPLVVLGDKPKAQLSRTQAKNIVLSFNQIGRAIPTFADAAAIADKIESSGIEFGKVKLIYNRFVSALSFEASVMEVFDAEALKQSPNLAAYEIEDDELLKDLGSFALANGIYAALVEGHAAEVSSRRNAMDNASKNASEMIQRLQMQFNRMRQTAITNDLVDIITGANAL